MPLRLPVTIVTGFLGVGKTTLLRYLLGHSNQRLAVMVNEFGTIGLDGDLIRSCGFCNEDELDSRVIELTNGCLCCTVQDDFLPKMEVLLKCSDRLDGIIVETSGLALPGPLIQALEWPAIRTRVYLNAVVTVVDGEALRAGSPIGDPTVFEQQQLRDSSLEHITAVDDLFTSQLQVADQVLISRADRITAEDFDRVCCHLQSSVRPGTSILAIEQGRINPLIVLGPQQTNMILQESVASSGADTNGYKSDHHDDHNHVEMSSGLVRYDGYISRREVEHLLPTLARQHQIVRIKGRVWLRGKPLPLQLQVVGPRLSSWFEATSAHSWQPPSGSGVDLVVLGFQELAAERIEAALASLSDTCRKAAALSSPDLSQRQ